MEVNFDTKLARITLSVNVAVKPEDEPAAREYLEAVAVKYKAELDRQWEERLSSLLLYGPGPQKGGL